MRSIEAIGSSIDQAIFRGLEQLEISIDEVDIEILQQESKGLLGIGARQAKVRLTEREPEQVAVPEYLKEQPREYRDRREQGDRREYGGRNGRGGRERREEPRAYGERPREEQPSRPAVPYSAEEAENNPAAQFLTGLLSRMGVEGRVLAHVNEEEGIRLRVDAPTMGVLIGHRGETLDALQYLTSLCVNRNRKAEGYTRVTLDTEGYREKREETLSRLARKIAGQVKVSGKARVLEPMNPYERRVLHATLQNHPYVTTHSEGEEPNRRVVITPKNREPRPDAFNPGDARE
ncbi:MAG: protein jag [Christensenellaceae bacterium]|jgi:spoIIIJ-associated protein|nr:protein jag [Christensenellaceae bacterium]